ncbi:MAG TPA: hypothetical protein VGY13_13495 [Solirubrobacteraceae bacterium]|nr:hypothetical protein [Solirubrobacteraceae bacterium]
MIPVDQSEHARPAQIQANEASAGALAELPLEVLQSRQQLLVGRTLLAALAGELLGRRDGRGAARVEQREQVRVRGEQPAKAGALRQAQRPCRHLLGAGRLEGIVG